MTKIKNRFDVLLWDVDGTLLDFIAAEKAAIKSLFIEFGLGECSDDMVADYSEINKAYWERLERGEMSKPEILVRRFEDFLRQRAWTRRQPRRLTRRIRSGSEIPWCSATTATAWFRPCAARYGNTPYPMVQ